MFQKAVGETFGDIHGWIANDLIIVGVKEGGSNQDATLKRVLERVREKVMCFNPNNLNKKVMQCKEIPFFGHIIGDKGIRPDSDKLRAIKEWWNHRM